MTVSTLFGSMVAILNADPSCGGAIDAVGYDTRAQCRAAAMKTGTRLRDRLLTACRYHLGSDITAMASLYGFNVDDPIANMLNVAKPPFENLWIEWPVTHQLLALGITPAPDVPMFAGALITRVKTHASRFMISYVHYSPEQGMVDMSPISLLIDTEHPIDRAEFAEQQELIHLSVQGRVKFAAQRPDDLDVEATLNARRDIPMPIPNFEQVLNSTLIGGAIEESGVKVNQLTQLFPYAVYCFTPGFSENLVKHLRDPRSGWHNSMKDIVTEHIAEHSGSMRFILGALAVLNDKQYVVRTPVKPGQKRPNEEVKPKVQPSYEFVTMNAPHVVYIRHIQGQRDSEKRRQHMRHEVSGTWVNYHKTGKADCVHEFANLDADGNRKICLMCGHKKSWRVAHERGNIELGHKQRAARVVLG